MKAKDAQKLRNMILAIGFILMVGAYIFKPLLIIGAIVAVSCMIPDYLYNKCPHCGKRLGRNEGRFCQHCGGKTE